MTKGWASVKKRTEEWANPPKASHLLKLFAEARYHRMFTAHGRVHVHPRDFRIRWPPRARPTTSAGVAAAFPAIAAADAAAPPLLSCFAGILLCQPLMFLILLPLQFLSFLLLLRKHSLLLLLVFTIAIRVA
jgi:hypothetical protein